ncbi:MAG TPA: hypothetical protein VNW46_14645, partial [Gemmatimonadaceae bacterium]|nr:hypothetical protein [Gemmatimonadaceae bacterium]
MAVTTLNTTLNAGVTYDTLQIFFIHNYTTTTATDTLTVACSGSGVSSCPTKRFVTVTPGTSVPDTVRFASGALNTTGTIQLTATSGSNSASATVNETSVWTSYATVSTAYTNAGDQDMTRCAVGCFAATATVSTVPYISRDTPRSVSLRYLGDRVAMRPFLIADVTLPANVPYTALWFQLSAAIKIGGAWTNVQFVNGDQTITFTGSGAQAGVPYRLAGAFDASTYPTGVYPVALTVSVVDSTHAEAHVDTLHLLIVNGRKYPVARGWSVAGVSRLYSSADTTLVGIDEGNGSSTVYSEQCSHCTYVSPAGVFNTLSSVTGTYAWLRTFADSTKQYFDATGLLRLQIDRLNDTAQFTYDASSRLTNISDPYLTSGGAHVSTVLTYNTSGPGLASIADPSVGGVSGGGRKTVFTVNPTDSLLTAVTLPSQTTSTHFGYDGQHRLDSLVDQLGDVTTLGYDSLTWKVVAVTSPSVPIDAGSTGSPTPTQLVTRDSSWQVVGMPRRPTSGSSPWPLTPSDSVKAVTIDAGGRTTRFTVDQWGQPLRSTDPTGQTTVTVTNGVGLVTSVTSPGGMKSQSFYTPQGLVSATIAPSGNAQSFYYGAFNQVDSITGTGQPKQTLYLGPRGRVDSVKVMFTGTMRHYYDALFRDTLAVSLVGDTTRYGYDPKTGNMNRVTAGTSGRFRAKVFDAFGRDSVVTVSGQSASATTTVYDSLNRVVQAYDGVHPTAVIYAYNALRDTSVTDPAHQHYSTAYNAMGWPTSQTDPQARTQSTTYTALGLPATVTNRRGQQPVRYQYDSFGRLQQIHRPSNASGELDTLSTFSYSALDTIVVAHDSVSTDMTFSSSSFGWVDSVVTVLNGIRFKRAYYHDAKGRVDSELVSTNAPAYAIDFYGRHYYYDTVTALLDSVVLQNARFRNSVVYQYSSTFVPTGLTYDNAVIRTDTMSANHLLLSTTYSVPAINAALHEAYKYDSTGRITEQDYPDTTSELFGFDGLGELNAWEVGKWTTTNPCTPFEIKNGYQCQPFTNFNPTISDALTFDSSGNLGVLDAVLAAKDTIGTTIAGNRLASWGLFTFKTDSDGDRASATNGTTSSQYTWGADGRLLRVVTGSNTVGYDYNAAGLLVRRTTNGVVDRYYLWD